jgi:hypothetical protein
VKIGFTFPNRGVLFGVTTAAEMLDTAEIANNASGDREKIQRTHRRVARHADGWQTAISDPDDLAWRLQDIREQAEALGRDPNSIETHLYHNVNINENREEVLDESKRFLDLYYTTDFT